MQISDYRLKQPIRLALFDMDGTLLSSSKQISHTTKNALIHASAQGIICAFGTGRSIAELSVYPELHSIMRYGVCESGALLYDFSEQKILSRASLTDETVCSIRDAYTRTDMAMQFFSEGRVYLQSDQLQHLEDYHMGQYRQLYQNVACLSDDISEELLKHQGKIEKINLFHRSTYDRTVTRERTAHLHAEIVDAEETSLEFSPMGVSKGSGLTGLGRILGLGHEESAAVGDADNDLPMLRIAVLSIAMGNANENVKAVSDYVVADNDHEGIAQAVELMLRV